MKNIILIGFMGTGKSVIGKKLAQRLKMSFIDTDNLIEEKIELTIPQIFSKFGESYFSKLEKSVIQEVVKRENTVISAGGGAVLDVENRENFKSNGYVICLSASPEMIIKRMNKANYRPLLKGDDLKQKVEDLLFSRSSFYAQADYTIDTSNLNPKEVVKKICSILTSDFKRDKDNVKER